MSARGVLLIGIVLAAFSFVSCCNVNFQWWIKLCVWEFLESGRKVQKPQIDPLSLQATTGHGELEYWEVQNPTVRGLRTYLHEQMVVNVEKRRNFKVDFVPKWPSITLHAGVEYVFCKSINNTFSASCVQLAGNVKISVINPQGKVAIRVERQESNGREVVKPRSRIDVNFFSVIVDFSVDEKSQNMTKHFGSPSVELRNELTRYWRNTAVPVIADRIRSQLGNVTNTYLVQGLRSRSNFFH